MNSFTLSLRYLRHRTLSTALNVITFASGVALMVALLLINAQLQQEFTKNLQGIDLVVGAKGSPMQLILSSVFHLDIPTGNIPLAEADKLSQHPLVKSTIPVALGDNFNGFRIVGTTPEYAAHYGATLEQGAMFKNEMEAVLGSEVAARQNLKLGDMIVGAHGLVNSDDLHSDFPYRVVGILRPTHTVVDRLVLTPVESVWHVHEHPDPDDPEEVEYKKQHPGKEITALLIHYKTPMAAVSLPRMINSTTAMQAASPAFEVARLTSFMGAGADSLNALGMFLLVLAGFGIFVALYNAMNDRRYDLALMRSFGAPPQKLFALIVTESLLISGIGTLSGMVLGHVGMGVFSLWLAGEKHIATTGAVWLPQEMWLLVAGLLIGLVAAVIPAIRVTRIDVFETLARR